MTNDTRRLLEFVKQAFDAEELGRVEVEGGAIGHAEERVAEPSPEEAARRFQDPKFTEAMRYLQSTLPDGLDTASPR